MELIMTIATKLLEPEKRLDVATCARKNDLAVPNNSEYGGKHSNSIHIDNGDNSFACCSKIKLRANR